MKLSVKLLTGLTLMALIAVAVVGLSHSASAAADAKIYITSKASNLTTESPAPTGRKTASTVYGTYASTTRDIVTDSDTFIVTIVDPDLNTTTSVTAVDGGTGFDIIGAAAARSANVIEITDPGGDGFQAIGDQFRIILDSGTQPIVGSVSDIKLLQAAADSDNEVAGLTVSEIFAPGDGTASNKPIITVNVTAAVTYTGVIRVVYPTSTEETTTATVTSVVDPVGTTLTLKETGRNTGRFEGYVKVEQHTTAAPTGANNAGTEASPTTVKAIGGPITVTYTDAATSGSATNVKRSVTAAIDTTPPSATITAPASGAETQDRTPTFTGSVADNQSGLDVSTFALFIDQKIDAANAVSVLSATAFEATPAQGSAASIDTSGQSDGVASMAFSHTPTQSIPTALVAGTPDHVVDFQVRVADLAGNYGYSDADSVNTTAGRHGNKPHTIKIDQIIPQISAASSGVGLDSSVSPAVDKANVRDTIKVSFDGKVKESSISASDFKVTLSGGGVFVPANVTVNGSDVYLDLDSTIPSDNKPTVAIQGTIQDLAGNSTDAGSYIAADKLSPVLTVTRSGGTGTGTGSEDSSSLTKGDMVITITSDENLQSAPAVTITDLTGPVTVNNGTPAVAQGGNVWKLTITKGASVSGNRAVKVVATDSTGNNSTTVGDVTTKAYTLDHTNPVATSYPANNGTTTQSNPFITTDYSGDQSSVTVTSATLDGVDVTSSVVSSADKKTFFFQPATALSNGTHKYIIKVKDAAGNESSTTTQFTKGSRTDFVIDLFAGWNAVSIPSNPLDDSIGSVFSNAGVKQVIAYDATTPAQPWRIASKVDGSFSSQTNPGLTSISAGHGYWVETSDFENQKVALHGPTGPGDARPALITIPTGNGWNFVGVVDQSRIQTQASDSGNALNRPTSTGGANSITFSEYFTNINVGRAYTFDTVASEFRSADATADTMKIGSGIWAFISPQENGKLPHIVP